MTRAVGRLVREWEALAPSAHDGDTCARRRLARVARLIPKIERRAKRLSYRYPVNR